MKPEPQSVMRVVVDSDGGIDDQVAVAYLASRRDIALAGVVATFGARPVALAARNLRMVLDLAGRSDAPVVVGAAKPTGPAPHLPAAVWLHGAEGLGDLEPRRAQSPLSEWSPEELFRSVGDAGPFSLLTLGPLSTVAANLESLAAVDRLVVMGGTLSRAGTVLPAAEANIARDPTAAATVVRHRWPGTAMIVGLDVTLKALADEGVLAAFRSSADNELGGLLSALLEFYAKGSGDRDAFPIHDLVAAIALSRSELFTWRRTGIAVDVGGSHAWGATVASDDPPSSPSGWGKWSVAVDVDVEAVRGEMARAAEGW